MEFRRGPEDRGPLHNYATQKGSPLQTAQKKGGNKMYEVEYAQWELNPRHKD